MICPGSAPFYPHSQADRPRFHKLSSSHKQIPSINSSPQQPRSQAASANSPPPAPAASAAASASPVPHPAAPPGSGAAAATAEGAEPAAAAAAEFGAEGSAAARQSGTEGPGGPWGWRWNKNGMEIQRRDVQAQQKWGCSPNWKTVTCSDGL